MSEDEKVNIAREIFQALPLKEFYADSLAPGARVMGSIVEDVMKAIHIALAPIQLAGVGQDRFRRFIEKARNNVAMERQIMPAPQVIGPVLEAIRYEPEGTPLEEMFAELLGSAMDKDRFPSVHPAFIQLITQLSSDEAVLLKALAGGRCRLNYRLPYDQVRKEFGVAEAILDERPMNRLMLPQSFDLYVLHLDNLGLVSYFDWKPQESEFEAIAQGGLSGQVVVSHRVQTATNVFKELKLTDWGTLFMMACSPSK